MIYYYTLLYIIILYYIILYYVMLYDILYYIIIILSLLSQCFLGKTLCELQGQGRPPRSPRSTDGVGFQEHPAVRGTI
jgi:hypothetical protein